MMYFKVNKIDVDSLSKILSASFPDIKYTVSANKLNFESTNPRYATLVQQVIKILEHSKKFENTSLHYENSYGDPSKRRFYDNDVHLELLARREINWLGNGLVILSGDFLKVKRALERYWLEYALNELQADEIENPALWSPEIAEQSKYLEDFPHEATFVFGAKKDVGSVNKVADLVSDKEFLSGEANNSGNFKALTLLGFCQPSVCTSCYYALGKRIPVKSALYTTYNRVFRNEGSQRLDRLLSFSVRDIVVVGDEEYVRKTREVFLQKAGAFIKDLAFEAKIVRATDPFFATKSSKAFMQKTADLKHEIQAWIPYDQKAIAVGSVNLHLDTFGKRFSMNLKNGTAFSACFGIGFERLTYSLFAQNGPILDDWGIDVVERLRLS
jgi:seryl-tRNA synthetase